MAVLNFLCGGNEACLHCIDSCSLSGSQWWIQVLSTVTICRTNLSWSDVNRSKNSRDDVALRARSRAVGLLGSSWYPSCRYHRNLQMVMSNSFNPSTWNFQCSHDLQYLRFQSSTISFSTAAITDGLTASDGLPDQILSSSDWHPRQNSLNYLVTV